MNCPFKKNYSRILSLIVVLTLLLGTLTGCLGSKDEETNDTSGNTPNLNMVDSQTDSTEPDPTETTAADANENIAVVTTQVNVRSAPSSTGKVIGYIDAGTEVEILRTEVMGEVTWALIREGWVPLENLDTNYVPSETTDPDATTPEETVPEETTAPSTTTLNIKGVVTATQLYIRKEASTESDDVGSYAKGDVVTILETKNGWGRTNKGWVSMQYVKTTADSTDNSTTGNNSTTTNNTTTNNTTNNSTTTSGKKGVVITNDLNIRKEASTSSDRVGGYTYGDRVTILETSGNWGRTDKGWISLSYVYQDGTTGSKSCKGIVTGTTLNVRSGPGTTYDRVATLNSGDRVSVLERLTINGTTWGCTSKGWISMDYVYVDGTTGTGSGTGTVTGDSLNIRSGPGTTYGSVGTLNSGDTVEILAQFTIGDMTWGCISKGWIAMKYVDMDE